MPREVQPTESPPDEAEYAFQRNPRLRLLIPLVVAFAFLMEQIDSTIIATAIPQMAIDLDTTVLRMNLAITAYVLALAVFIPISGWLADRFGARRIFILALLVFTVSSVLCGMAESHHMLVATRVMQGIGGAMMTPVGRLILLRSFPRKQYFTAIIYMSIPALMGPIIGPLLGGLLTTYVSWRWIFYINIPFGLLGMALAYRYIGEFRTPERVGFDLTGFLMVGSGLALLQFAIENMNHPIVPPVALVCILVLAAGLLLGFYRHARRTRAPAVDLTLFRIRAFRVGTLVGGICRIGINGVPYLLPLMLQLGFGMSPIQSGSLTFCTSLGALTIRPISRWLLKTLGFDRVLIGSAIVAAAVIAGFALIDVGLSRWAIGAYIAVYGLIRSTQLMSSSTLAYADLPTESLSRATSLGSVMQQLSVSFGVSLAAMLLGLVSETGQPLTLADFHQVFLLVAVIPLLAAPGFAMLRPEDGEGVSGHQRKSRMKDRG